MTAEQCNVVGCRLTIPHSHSAADRRPRREPEASPSKPRLPYGLIDFEGELYPMPDQPVSNERVELHDRVKQARYRLAGTAGNPGSGDRVIVAMADEIERLRGEAGELRFHVNELKVENAAFSEREARVTPQTTTLPEELRDPIKAMERGRMLNLLLQQRNEAWKELEQLRAVLAHERQFETTHPHVVALREIRDMSCGCDENWTCPSCIARNALSSAAKAPGGCMACGGYGVIHYDDSEGNQKTRRCDCTAVKTGAGFPPVETGVLTREKPQNTPCFFCDLPLAAHINNTQDHPWRIGSRVTESDLEHADDWTRLRHRARREVVEAMRSALSSEDKRRT